MSEVSSMDQNDQLRAVLLQQLESLQAVGIETVPKGFGKLTVAKLAEPAETAETAQSTPPAATTTVTAASAGDGVVAPAASVIQPQADSATTSSDQANNAAGATIGGVPSHQRAGALQVIQAEVENCSLCSDLCTKRTKTVFGVGNPNARLVFVGEGPGADEDRIGEPFVGAAGQLLDKILNACTLSRDDVYILNTVKCRPPGNRNPAESELENCWPYAVRQLEIIQPEFICCLGSVAAKTVLETKLSIGKLRGQFHQLGSSKVVVTYHPAYLLRTPSAKKHTWNDMKMLMSEMGIELPN